MTGEQQAQQEWLDQWSLLEDNERFLFEEWIQPHSLAAFRGKEVLECGCGGGQHTAMLAEVAASVTAVDLNTAELARQRNAGRANVSCVAADLATMALGRRFDVVISIGVVHHTDNPERTVANLRRHLKPGGLLILWLYSREGNALARLGVEPVRKLLLRHLPRTMLLGVARLVTALLYPPVWSLYLLPLPFLPYYAYFGNFRRLSFQRNLLNVFDKLNAPQTDFIDRRRAEAMVSGLERTALLPYKGVSWSVSGYQPETGP